MSVASQTVSTGIKRSQLDKIVVLQSTLYQQRQLGSYKPKVQLVPLMVILGITNIAHPFHVKFQCFKKQNQFPQASGIWRSSWLFLTIESLFYDSFM